MDTSKLTNTNQAALDLPDDVAQALAGNPAAQAAYEKLPPSHKREYLNWINSAKRPETRNRRIADTITKLQSPK